MIFVPDLGLGVKCQDLGWSVSRMTGMTRMAGEE